MHILIETANIEVREIPSRKSGVLYFTAVQQALMFKEGSKYPHHVELRHVFSENKIEAEQSKPLQPGMYALTDDVFVVSRYKDIQLNLIASALKPIKAAVPLDKAS